MISKIKSYLIKLEFTNTDVYFICMLENLVILHVIYLFENMWVYWINEIYRKVKKNQTTYCSFIFMIRQFHFLKFHSYKDIIQLETLWCSKVFALINVTIIFNRLFSYRLMNLQIELVRQWFLFPVWFLGFLVPLKFDDLENHPQLSMKPVLQEVQM